MERSKYCVVVSLFCLVGCGVPGDESGLVRSNTVEAQPTEFPGQGKGVEGGFPGQGNGVEDGFPLGEPSVPCESDSDCAADSWCRGPSSIDGTFSCAAFVGVGESCGGFVLPEDFEKCEPGLVCVLPVPPDNPGICAVE